MLAGLLARGARAAHPRAPKGHPAAIDARLDPVRLEHVGRRRHRRGSEPQQRVRPGRHRGRDLARDHHHLAPVLEREVRGDQGSGPLPRLDDHGRPTEAGDDAVPGRKAPRGRLDAGFVLRDDQTVHDDPAREVAMRGRVVAVDAATEDGDRHSAGVERAPVSFAVDATRQAADDDEACRCELAGERPRDRATVRRSRPGRRRWRQRAGRAARASDRHERRACSAGRGWPREAADTSRRLSEHGERSRDGHSRRASGTRAPRRDAPAERHLPRRSPPPCGRRARRGPDHVPRAVFARRHGRAGPTQPPFDEPPRSHATVRAQRRRAT